MSQEALRAPALNTATPGTGVSEGSAASDHAHWWPWALPAAMDAAWRVIARVAAARSASRRSEAKGSQERRRRGVLRVDGFDGGTRLEDRALPAPVINAAAGDFRESGQVTLTGAFGSVGPQVVLFDDFNRGTDAAPIRTGAGSATVGSWSAIQGQITYSSASTVSGSLLECDNPHLGRDLVDGGQDSRPGAAADHRIRQVYRQYGAYGNIVHVLLNN